MKALLTLAVIAVLYLAADLFIPIALAMVLNLLLSPVVRWLKRLHIPLPVAAGLVVITLIMTIVLAVAVLAAPAEQWFSDAPKNIREMQLRLRDSGDQFTNIQELADEVEGLTSLNNPSNQQQVVVTGPGMFESLLSGLPSAVAFIGIVTFLTYFLLASGDTMLRRVTKCGRDWSERRRIVTATRQIQSELSRYLGTVTSINALLGSTVAISMYYLNVPNPMLWGAMVFVFNFAPYIGALASAVVLTIVGLTTFVSLSDALLVPVTFICLTIIEGQLFTPAFVGRRLSLSPVVVFLSVIVWGWLWGVAGALMAVPLVTCLKVVSSQVPALQPIGAYLRSEPARAANR